MKRPSFTAVCLLTLSLAFGTAMAIDRKEFSGRSAAPLAPVYQNDGDVLDGFSISCSSTAWTTVKASRPARRRLHIQVLDSNSYGVCVSTVSTVGVVCDDSAVGVELSTGVANLSQVDVFSEGPLNCRARAGSAGERIKGYETYDSGD